MSLIDKRATPHIALFLLFFKSEANNNCEDNVL